MAFVNTIASLHFEIWGVLVQVCFLKNCLERGPFGIQLVQKLCFSKKPFGTTQEIKIRPLSPFFCRGDTLSIV